MRNNLNSKIHLSFDDHDESPLHQKIERFFINSIRQGCFAENERLPSIRELATSNYISTNTVKKAFQYLESSKWIYKKRRLGIFVCYKEEYREEIERNREVWLQRNNDLQPQELTINDHPSMKHRFSTPVFETLLFNLANENPARNHKWRSDAESFVKKVVEQLLYEQSGMVIDTKQLMLYTDHERALSFVLRTLFSTKSNKSNILVAGICSEQDKWLFDLCNLSPITIKVNKKGLVLPHLTVACKLYRPKLLLIDTSLYYMDATHVDRFALQNLLEIIREYELMVIEHNPDRELWYGKGCYPLLSTLDSERVIYLGAISNLIEPLNRVQIIRAPISLIQNLYENDTIESPFKDNELMQMAASILAGYKWRKSLKDIYLRYGNLRETVKTVLDKRLADILSYDMPPSGLSCWFYPLNYALPKNIKKDFDAFGGTFALRTDYFSSSADNFPPAIFFTYAHLLPDQVNQSIEQLLSLIQPK